MSKTNPIVLRSRAALVGAATELLDEREAAAVSVKDVCERAGMSRPTFYQHFADLGALFASAGLARLAGDLDGLEPGGSLVGTFTASVDRMLPHLEFYCRISAGPGGQLFQAELVRHRALRLRREPALAVWGERDDVFWEFLAAGWVWVMTRHLHAVRAGEPSDVTPGLEAVFGVVLTSEPN
ncbi:TetR/AcrR family transcriptional regulator [Kineosporia succinea]|uniref:AcrR family transcriptional regulator n=1 Tax=Kineosporia succinea TaxID=84632 RepID=A0ABT9PDC3_9ACTN|nr:TetR/AcrR family transcriptional regulator [Kineosporia succinea]MDP9830709.1 AcrR family transcriptional regulator [Kineosporia succinea]